MLHSGINALSAQLAPDYLQGLHELTNWSARDRERCEIGKADDPEHLLEGLRILDRLSRVTGETIGLHDSEIATMRGALDDTEGLSGASLAEQLQVAGFLETRRQRYIGTSDHLAQLFDKICRRLSGSTAIGGSC